MNSSQSFDIKGNDYISLPCSKNNFFTREECKKIILLSKDLELVEASVGKVNATNIQKGVRHSEIKWLAPDDRSNWVFEKLMAAVQQVNKFYNFDLVGIEAMQIARYEKGGFYDWHCDIGKGTTSRRKLSVSVQLSEANDYQGGDLEFIGIGEHLSTTEIGSAITFPSYLIHRVKPVTSGTRWSLVAWVFGQPFC